MSGAATAAQPLFVAAARLESDRDRREADLTDAVKCLLSGGDVDGAAAFAHDFDEFADDARRTYLEGAIAFAAGRVSVGRQPASPELPR